MKSILLSLVPLTLLLPTSLALVAQHKNNIPGLQPRPKPWNTQYHAHHGTAYLPSLTTTITTTATVTVTLPGAFPPEPASTFVFPTNTTLPPTTTTAAASPLAPPPTPNTIPPLTLIDLNTFSLPPADPTSAAPADASAAPTADAAAGPTPNDIPPVQLITIV